jgi:hypothetical protein
VAALFIGAVRDYSGKSPHGPRRSHKDAAPSP